MRCYPPAQVAPRDGGIRRQTDRPSAPCVTPEDSSHRWCGGREENSWRDHVESDQDISARDDAHLESLGIKPQLNRSLGFLANFALAFSFISVSTGSFGNFGVGFGLGGPIMFWTWLIIVAGQFIVALGFAELASHYPVAGSIYQWSKRLSHRTLGWFTGWFYFWAQVVTVTAVACIVAFVVDGIMGQERLPGEPVAARRQRHVHVHRHHHARHHDADQRVRRPARGDAQQHRRRDRDPRACSSSR